MTSRTCLNRKGLTARPKARLVTQHASPCPQIPLLPLIVAIIICCPGLSQKAKWWSTWAMNSPLPRGVGLSGSTSSADTLSSRLCNKRTIHGPKPVSRTLLIPKRPSVGWVQSSPDQTVVGLEPTIGSSPNVPNLLLEWYAARLRSRLGFKEASANSATSVSVGGLASEGVGKTQQLPNVVIEFTTTRTSSHQGVQGKPCTVTGTRSALTVKISLRSGASLKCVLHCLGLCAASKASRSSGQPPQDSHWAPLGGS
jgi:hypothetical protein